MKKIDSNKGFTLIELIVVIVILGILSVVAVPKFIDLKTDAKIAQLNGLKGAINSANTIARSAAILQHVDFNKGWISKKGTSNTDFDATPMVNINGTKYVMIFGYLDRLYVLGAIQNTQEFSKDANGNALQDDKNTHANTDCSNNVHNKECDYDWCACRLKVGSVYTEIFVPNGVNPKQASTQGCYLQYTNANQTRPPIITVNSDNC